ncbi:MAG: tetratricopeptide repeat protein [Leptospirales bacterium]
MKYFDRNFREREDDPAVSEKAVDYYRGARRYFEERAAEMLAKNSHAVSEETPAAQIEIQADLGRAVSRLGEALRFAGRIPEALECKLRSLEIWEKLQRSRAIYLARIRLAVVLDQAERGSEALEILRELRAELALGDADLIVYADFIHESLALVLIRAGDSAAAIPELDAALAIRRRRGHAKTIDRTLDLLRRLGQKRG